MARGKKYKTNRKQRVRSMKYNDEHREEIFERRKKLRKPAVDKICEICGNKYKSRVAKQKYCSPECVSEKAQREYRMRERNIGNTSIWEIFNRDNFTCQYCGRNPTEDGIKLHLDHIKPKFDGGTDEWENLVTSCEACNVEKGTRSLRNEAGFKERLSLKKKD